MIYSRLSVERVLAQHQDIRVLDLARLAVEDHALRNGCSFQDDAGARAVYACGFDPLGRASVLHEDQRERLSRALEALEIDCPHKEPQGSPGEAGSHPSATDGASEATARVAGLCGLSEGIADGFKPGTFGCHEALDRTSVYAELVSDLADHAAIKDHPEWRALAHQASNALFDLYQAIGKEHLPMTIPTGAGASLTISLQPELLDRLNKMTEVERIEKLDPICAVLKGKAKAYDGAGIEVLPNRIFALAAIDLYQAWQQESFERE